MDRVEEPNCVAAREHDGRGELRLPAQMLQEFSSSCISDAVVRKTFFRPVQSTSIPKAHFPQQNVTAKLSNGLVFTGYLLDTLRADSQNYGCFCAH
jgi:hypothetical protein